MGQTQAARNSQAAKVSLPEEAAIILEGADKVELLSISPCDGKLKPPVRGKKEPFDEFGGCRVLGKMTLKKDDAAKQNLILGLYRGIMYADGSSRCFLPRHGLRATYEGFTLELLICFECNNYVGLAYKDTESESFAGEIGGQPQDLFNRILTSGKVRLDKP